MREWHYLNFTWENSTLESEYFSSNTYLFTQPVGIRLLFLLVFSNQHLLNGSESGQQQGICSWRCLSFIPESRSRSRASPGAVWQIPCWNRTRTGQQIMTKTLKRYTLPWASKLTLWTDCGSLTMAKSPAARHLLQKLLVALPFPSQISFFKWNSAYNLTTGEEIQRHYFSEDVAPLVSSFLNDLTVFLFFLASGESFVMQGGCSERVYLH